MKFPKNKLPECYYDAAKAVYIITNGRNGWMPMSETNMRRRLKVAGFSTVLQPDETISPLDDALLTIQDEHNIDYFGRLAGYKAGVRDVLGFRVLVSDSPTLIEPVAGECPVLIDLLEGMLSDPEHNQLHYLLGWLKVGLECLYSGYFRPGQALVLAGPPECGKSLLQGLFTRMFGGRSAKPYQYMIEATSFNADLFAAEHLMIEDEASSTDLRTRRAFGGHLKQFASAGSQRCHPKGRDPLSLLPFWRLSVSVNDEPENLMVMPPIDDSLADKIILLRAAKSKMPMPLETSADHDAFGAALVAELPAFVHWLMNEWQIPAGLHSDRYGVTHFHHPALLEALGDLAPETHLLMLIDRVLFATLVPDAWEGTASELQTRLFESSAVAFEARKLLGFSTACGVYLGRLAKQHGERISEKVTRGSRRWKIEPPTKMAEAA